MLGDIDSLFASTSPTDEGRALASFLQFYPEAESEVVRALVSIPPLTVEPRSPKYVDEARYAQRILNYQQGNALRERVTAFAHVMLCRNS